MKGVVNTERRIANRKIREILGLSGKDLSDRVECTRQTISNYECGKTSCRYLERVIEIELDLAINQCTDKEIVELCRTLQQKSLGF